MTALLYAAKLTQGNFKGFLLNIETVPVNHGLVNLQYTPRKMLQQKLYCKYTFISYSKCESVPSH